MMRFKTGLCLKLFILVGFLLFTVILVKEKNVSSQILRADKTEEEDRIKNLSKASSSEVAVGEVKSGQEAGDALELQLADASDSLAGNRIDGLPNITEPRYHTKICQKISLSPTRALEIPKISYDIRRHDISIQ